MATSSVNYDPAFDAVTISLASLSDGAYRQSASRDNDAGASDRFNDISVGGKIRTGSVAPDVGSLITILAYGRNRDGGFTAGASGSDAAYTADGEEDELKFLDSITVDGDTATDYEFGPVSLAAVFGGVVPEQWGIVVLNETGQDLDSTGGSHIVEGKGIKYDST